MDFLSEKTKHIEQKFVKLIKTAYNYEEALKRQNLRQEDVDLLRERAKGSKSVPKFIIDKQVR